MSAPESQRHQADMIQENSPHALGMSLAKATAPAFVAACRELSIAERIELILAFFAYLAGMAEQSVGHQASRDVLSHVAAMKPAGPVNRLQ